MRPLTSAAPGTQHHESGDPNPISYASPSNQLVTMKGAVPPGTAPAHVSTCTMTHGAAPAHAVLDVARTIGASTRPSSQE
jgi:hypothetical protein